MLEQERQYFADHRDELRVQYPGKFVLVHGDVLAGSFATQDEALSYGAREFGLSSFLVRHVDQPLDVEVNVPALTLGILRRADSPHTVRS
jgi:hypothetical protein